MVHIIVQLLLRLLGSLNSHEFETARLARNRIIMIHDEAGVEKRGNTAIAETTIDYFSKTYKKDPVYQDLNDIFKISIRV